MLQRIIVAAVAAGMLGLPALAEVDAPSPPGDMPVYGKTADTEDAAAKPAIRKVEAPAKTKAKPAAGKKVPADKPAVRPVAVAAAKTADTPPAGNALIFHDATAKSCIGGVQCQSYCADPDRVCEAKMSYVVTLDKPQYISAIQLNAHDNIGKSRRSKLIVKVNGETLDSKPVFRLGSSVSLMADTVGQVITIESAHQHNGFLRGGEEAMIWDVYVFGSEQAPQ